MRSAGRNKPSAIIVHCSDSLTGNAKVIDGWHRERGFRKIGYHYVICRDGTLEVGRAENEIGAHCPGYNAKSIGICLIGRGEYTLAQLAVLDALVRVLRTNYAIEPEAVLGHGETPSGKRQGKTCPLLDMDALRERIA